MNNKLIGRIQEEQVLLDALASNEAELVSVIGRRRVGKTFLITSAYQNHITFEITGIQRGSLKKQLRNFRDVLVELNNTGQFLEPPVDWLAAFGALKMYLKQQKNNEKKVLFFDELPWLATPKSGFLEAFGYFWNSWASRQNLVIVICGSAASWMIRKVVRDKGSLHNRITKRINLKPFTLAETEKFLRSRNIRFDHYTILQLYMVMGGIPHYLKEIKQGKSGAQNIDEICFSETGLLKEEFPNLYEALFKNADRHIDIIQSLLTKNQGMTRNEIVQYSKLSSGRILTQTLEELIQSGFINIYYPFGKKTKEKLYRLTDEYSLFYLLFMEEKINETKGIWKHFSQTQAYKTWSGYAFESICLKHLPQIKRALGVSGVYTLASTFYKKGTEDEPGVQIDLVLDRNDHVVNLFEIKFYNDTFSINKATAQKLRHKMSVFRNITQTKKQLFWTIMTTFGLKHNQHSLDLIDSAFGMDILFEDAD